MPYNHGMKMPWNLTRPIFVLALIGTATVATTTVAAAASPPVAVTGPTSSLTVTGATLTGDVGPIGSATTWYFQYGTTPNYGLRTPSASAGAATSTVAVATRVVGLTPGTTYHERLVGTSAAGTGVGSDVVFRTPAVPPSILVASASPVHDTSARVIADINPNGLATTWVVRFGATTSYGGSTAALAAGSSTEPGDHAATLSKLVPNTTYHYDVVATNAAGTTIGPDEHFVTTGPPILSPASFSSLTPTSVTLKATVWPGGHGTVWYFQYGTTTTYTSATAALLLPATTRPLAVSKAIANLEPNTTYHFRLVAKNAAGTVGDADTAFTTPGPTIASSTPSTDFGHPLTLSGSVPTGAADEVVALYAATSGNPTFVEVASLLTGPGGTWTYVTTPSIQTTYMARWKSETSSQLTVGVRPSIILRGRPGGRFITHVTAARPFVGAVVRLQRLSNGQWRTIAARHLNRDSSAAFHPSALGGISRLRVYLTPYQAGVGYLGAYSGVHVAHSA